jgi:hypothetical protein
MYLWILVLKTVALNIERITSCLWPTVEEFIFPLDASKRAEMAMWTTNKIASDDCVQLFSNLQQTLLIRDIQLLTKISSNPLSQFDVRYAYVMYSSPGSKLSSWTTLAGILGGMEYKGSTSDHAGFKVQKVKVYILLSMLSFQIADSLLDRKRQIIS